MRSCSQSRFCHKIKAQSMPCPAKAYYVLSCIQGALTFSLRPSLPWPLLHFEETLHSGIPLSQE